MIVAATLDAGKGVHQDGLAERAQEVLPELRVFGVRKHMHRIHTEAHSLLILSHILECLLQG
ncbi:MAG: hypothetical protein ACK56I_20290, partial [bacterium]